MATTTSEEFEKATDFQFKEDDIERAKALVGRWAPSGSREFLTTATPDAMRNFARGYGDDNPLFASEDYGTTTRWGGQIAPPMIPIALNRPLYGDPPKERIKRPSFRGIHVFVSGSTWQWFRPLQEGDELYSFGGTESVVEKKSEFAERSLLVTYASVKMNQRAEIVAISRTLAIHTERKTAREKGKYAAIEPATYTDEDIERIDAVYAAEEARGAEPRYWEDVHVGDVLAPMAKGPLTTTDMIVFHAGGYGFVPYEPCANRIAYKNRQRIAPFYVKNEYGVPDVAQRVHWDYGLGAGHRQPDGLRLRGDARLLAQPLHDRLHGRRRLAGLAVERDPQVQLHRRHAHPHRRGRRQAPGGRALRGRHRDARHEPA